MYRSSERVEREEVKEEEAEEEKQEKKIKKKKRKKKKEGKRIRNHVTCETWTFVQDWTLPFWTFLRPPHLPPLTQILTCFSVNSVIQIPSRVNVS